MRRADQRKFHYLYKIVRNDGSNKYYIGIHSTDVIEDGYFGSGKRLWRSIKKHGKDLHTKEILEFFESRKELVEKEAFLVNEQMLKDSCCLNISLGGNAGYPLTGETEEGKKSRGLKIGNSLRGIPKSRESIEKMALAQRGKPKPRKIDPSTGKKKPMSEEHKRKISEACKGKKKPMSEEHKLKISDLRKGIIFTPEHKQNISKGVKKSLLKT